MALLAEKHFDSDPHLALAALREVAQYLRPKLQSIKVEAEVEHKHVDFADIGRKFDDLMRKGRDELPAIEDKRQEPLTIDGEVLKDHSLNSVPIEGDEDL